MNQKFAKRLSEKPRETLREKFNFEKVHIEEILQQSHGYGVAPVLVGKESKVAGFTLIESGLRDADLMVLSIEGDETIIPVPKAQSKIEIGDRLVCYGKLENLEGLV